MKKKYVKPVFIQKETRVTAKSACGRSSATGCGALVYKY